MSDDDNDRGTLSNHSDSFLIPVTTDGTKLLWDGNAATILGLLAVSARRLVQPAAPRSQFA